MFNLSRLARITALAFGVATPLAAETDPLPGLTDFFSINRIGAAFANTAIAGLRTQMEIEYDFLSTDLMRGTVSISGVTARPILEYDQARQCVVTVDRATLNTDVAKPFEVASEVNLNLLGAKVSSACLPREAAMGLRMAGMREIEVDQLKMRLGYTYTTGETSTEGSIAINNFATLDFSASGMILPRPGDFGPGDPAFRVMRAVVSLKDKGGWNVISQVIPENMRDPETIKLLGTEAVTQALSSGGARVVTAVERNFVTQLMDRVGDYVADPGEITIEANLPDTGIVIEPEIYNDEPEALISTLALEARATPLARSVILSTADLAALKDPAGASADQLLNLAAALLNGAGVPQVPALVPELLDRVMDDPAKAPQAAAMIARAWQDTQPLDAYPFALLAAEGGVASAVSLLDRLEAQMTTTQVLDAQAEVLGPPAPAVDRITDNDPRALRRLSLGYLTGSGVTRSYAEAYYYALLAEAAGDIGATALKNEIEDRFSERGAKVAQAWQGLSADLQAQALTDWIEGGLADRYVTR